MSRRRRLRQARFDAPWGRTVTVVTTSVIVLVLGMAAVPLLIMLAEGKFKWVALAAPAVALVALIVLSLFGVWGYAIHKDELWVRRTLWQTRVSLSGLRAATVDSDAMKRAWRTAGNGGFMAFTGWFRNKRLGSYRAFVTDARRCVVLEFEDRKIVVSPDKPRRFVEALGLNPATTRKSG